MRFYIIMAVLLVVLAGCRVDIDGPEPAWRCEFKPTTVTCHCYKNCDFKSPNGGTATYSTFVADFHAGWLDKTEKAAPIITPTATPTMVGERIKLRPQPQLACPSNYHVEVVGFHCETIAKPQTLSVFRVLKCKGDTDKQPELKPSITDRIDPLYFYPCDNCRCDTEKAP